MRRWFVTGDCHQDLTKIYKFIDKFELGAESNIIVCGDMGIFWRQDEEDAKQIIAEFERKCNGVNLYWLDGNHENFDIINKWIVSQDGLVHNSNHIHYIPRGTILSFNINNQNKKALFIGGADSVDKIFRTEHKSWWTDEVITDDNINNIDEGYFDFVFSHCCPFSEVQQAKGWLFTISNITDNNAIHTSEKQLDKLKNKISFNCWYFGHYHIDKQLNEKFRCLLNDFIELE